MPSNGPNCGLEQVRIWPNSDINYCNQCGQAIMETQSELLARLDAQDAAEMARLASTYPCLIEVRLPELPTTVDGLREALAAFVRQLGLPYAINDGSIVVYGAQSVQIDLSNVDAVAPKRPDEPDNNLDRRLAELATDDEQYWKDFDVNGFADGYQHWSTYRVRDDRDMERRGQVGHGCD